MVIALRSMFPQPFLAYTFVDHSHGSDEWVLRCQGICNGNTQIRPQSIPELLRPVLFQLFRRGRGLR
jgi:hypothetical protein